MDNIDYTHRSQTEIDVYSISCIYICMYIVKYIEYYIYIDMCSHSI